MRSYFSEFASQWFKQALIKERVITYFSNRDIFYQLPSPYIPMAFLVGSMRAHATLYLVWLVPYWLHFYWLRLHVTQKGFKGRVTYRLSITQSTSFEIGRLVLTSTDTTVLTLCYHDSMLPQYISRVNRLMVTHPIMQVI